MSLPVGPSNEKWARLSTAVSVGGIISSYEREIYEKLNAMICTNEFEYNRDHSMKEINRFSRRKRELRRTRLIRSRMKRTIESDKVSPAP